MGPVWQAILYQQVIPYALLALALLLALFVLRTWHLTRRVGVFESALALPDSAPLRDGWACYRAGRLEWFPNISLRTTPRHTWAREGFEILEAAPATSPRSGQPVRRVLVRAGGEQFALVVSEGSYAGLRSWIESAPPSWESVAGEGPSGRNG